MFSSILLLLAFFMPQSGLTGVNGAPILSNATVSSGAIVTTTLLSTSFNEASNVALTSTQPLVDLAGSAWATWPSLASMQYLPGSGATDTSSVTAGNAIDTGSSAYTATFNVSNTATTIVAFSAHDATLNDRVELWMLGSGGIALKETVAGTITTITTQAVSNGALGTVVAVVNGSTITVTAFGGTPMTYTIPTGHADLNGSFIAILATPGASSVSGITVTH
jgi:hypothetical protein